LISVPPLGKFGFAEVTKANRADFEKLFEAKGGPSYCWCMAWRAMADRQHTSNADRKAGMMSRIAAARRSASWPIPTASRSAGARSRRARLI
jgi:hypothetical protein